MRTDVSLPDDLFQSAEALAAKLGVSRSELYTTALARLLAEHRQSDVTARLDVLYAREDSRLPADLGRLQTQAVRMAAGESEDW